MKKSLKEFKKLLGKNTKYIEFSRRVRGCIAWLKMGGWIWQGQKDEEGVRRCPLCQEKDGITHIFLSSSVLEEERVKLQLKFSAFNFKHVLQMRDENVIVRVGGFLNKARTLKIKKALKKKKNSFCCVCDNFTAISHPL